ncbi:tetratricopeptide repeat protein, partial [Candidatus Poribacteria bacterium]|nr:tetratricopeptide repeat protein [Candidatus Poribacteria bacterium]
LKIVWPSGTTQELTSIPTNQIIEVTEGKGWQVVEASAMNQRIDLSTNHQSPITNHQLEREQVRRFWDTYRRAISIMKTESDWNQSAALFREALAIDPNHEDSIYYLGNCLFELGDYPGALAQFQRLVEINSHSLRGNLQIGAVYACPDSGKLFDLNAAEHALQRALAINPEESGSLLQLGAVALAKGNLEGASKYFSMARQLNFKAVDAYYLDGYIQWKRGDLDVATDLLRKAVEYSHAPLSPFPSPPGEGREGRGGQAGASPPHVLGEGDTKRADRGALTSTTVHQRRLFGEQLDALKARKPNEAITKQVVVEEYQRLGQYLAKLK